MYVLYTYIMLLFDVQCIYFLPLLVTTDPSPSAWMCHQSKYHPQNQDLNCLQRFSVASLIVLIAASISLGSLLNFLTWAVVDYVRIQ